MISIQWIKMRFWINLHDFLTVQLVKHFSMAERIVSILVWSSLLLASSFSLMNTSLLLCHPILSWNVGLLSARIFIFSLIFHVLKVQVWDYYILIIFTHNDYSKPANHFVKSITFIISYHIYRTLQGRHFYLHCVVEETEAYGRVLCEF